MKKNKTEMNPIIKDDILRYKKNKFASNFALLALVFNCLYFMLLYSVNKVDYYKILLGFSVIVNLFVLLAGFFCSEGIKAYNKKFAFALFVLAAVQIARIFIYPLMGMRDNWLRDNAYFGVIMTSPVQGTILIIFLAASAGCFIASGVQGLIAALRLKSFQKKIDAGEISVEETLKQLDEEDAKKTTVAEQSVMTDGMATETVEAADKTLSSEEVDNG